MDIFANFATNTKSEEEGVWVTLGGTSKILVARAGNKKYGRMLNAQVEKNQAALDLKTDEADELSDSIMVDVFANSILLGWENLSYQGEPLDYSVDNAKKLLAIKDFRVLVANHSKNIENYRVAVEVAKAKK